MAAREAAQARLGVGRRANQLRITMVPTDFVIPAERASVPASRPTAPALVPGEMAHMVMQIIERMMREATFRR